MGGSCCNESIKITVMPFDLLMEGEPRRAVARSAVFADAHGEVSGPGRIEARWRTRVIGPRMPSNCSRSSAAAMTMMDLSVCIAWVFALTAASRAILRCRIISTVLVPVFGSAAAWPERTARAAASASSMSVLPFRRRVLRSGRLTSRT